MLTTTVLSHSLSSHIPVWSSKFPVVILDRYKNQNPFTESYWTISMYRGSTAYDGHWFWVSKDLERKGHGTSEEKHGGYYNIRKQDRDCVV